MRYFFLTLFVTFLALAEDERPVKPPSPPKEAASLHENKSLVFTEETIGDRVALALLKPLLSRNMTMVPGGFTESSDDATITWSVLPDVVIPLPDKKPNYTVLWELYITLNRQSGVINREDSKALINEASPQLSIQCDTTAMTTILETMDSAYDNYIFNGTGQQGQSLTKQAGHFKFLTTFHLFKKHPVCTIRCSLADPTSDFAIQLKKDCESTLEEAREIGGKSRARQGNMLLFYIHRSLYPDLYKSK